MPSKSKAQKKKVPTTKHVRVVQYIGFPYQAEVLSIVFFLLSFIVILYHEPWRDELQAYLLGRESYSIRELLNNIKYEGHPPLWHLILFIQSHLIDSFFVSQIIHSIIATVSIYLLNKFFTLDYRLKILSSFSYFLFFEYNIVVRSYGLGIMLFFAAIALYTQYIYKSSKSSLSVVWRYVVLGLLLLLLSNTSVLGMVMSAALMALIFTDYLIYLREKSLSRVRVYGAFVVLIFFIIATGISYHFIKSEPDNSYPVNYTKGLDMNAVKFALSKIFTNYFVILPTENHFYWNVHVLLNQELSTAFYLGFLTLILFGLYFTAHSRVVLFYLSGTMAMLLFLYLTNMRPYRYSGHLFIFLLTAYSLAEFYKNDKQLVSIIQNSFLDSLARYAFIAILLFNVYSASIAFYKDLKYPFSNFTSAGEYIMKNKLNRYALMGSSDFIVSPLTYYTHNAVFLPESKREQRFIIWDGARRSKVSFNDIISELNEQVLKHDTVLLILSTPLTFIGPDQKNHAFMEDHIAGTDIHLKYFHKIDTPNSVNDENYYFYMANKVKP